MRELFGCSLRGVRLMPYGDALDADEFQFLFGRALDFQAKLDGFTDPFGDLIEGTALCMAAVDLGNRRYVVSLGIALNHDIKLTWHLDLLGPIVFLDSRCCPGGPSGAFTIHPLSV